jgi:Armadillo/beta-catenin-like repeat
MVVDAGAVRACVHLLKHGSDGGREASACLLAEIAPLAAARRSIANERGVHRLVQTLNSGSLIGREAAASTLFCLGPDVQVGAPQPRAVIQQM